MSTIEKSIDVNVLRYRLLTYGRSLDRISCSRVQRNLECFKKYIERNGARAGAESHANRSQRQLSGWPTKQRGGTRRSASFVKQLPRTPKIFMSSVRDFRCKARL